MSDNYDVIIVGAGPAGIFTALELVKTDGVKVLMLEKGPDIEERNCYAKLSKCRKCETCAITSGWGGAGAFSDGKLSLAPEVGGWLGEYVGTKQLRELIDRVDQLYLEFGAPRRIFGDEPEKIQGWKRKAILSGLILTPCPFRHMGTERSRQLLVRMRGFLEDKIGLRTSCGVESILVDSGRVAGVRIASGEEIEAPNVVVAPGRDGADWLAGEMGRLGVELFNNAVDIGLRIEVPAPIVEPMTSDLYEPKLHYFTRRFEDRVRIFCMNPYGQVCVERFGDVLTVNGHSYAEQRTDNSNFALLVSTTFTEPFREPIAYGKYIARLANLLGEGILVQRLGDLLEGHRSTPRRISRSTVQPTLASATPGDLSFVLPYRYISDILEMLEALDNLCPGLYQRDTLLYGVEVKFYSSRPKLGADLQAEIRGLYAIGDGAGITRGLVQASAAGIVAAQSILSARRT
ncbi:MAG: FAD-dependent oxidoreductase [Candidatus Solincola sediminis]|uniref:FAD-dependent oxidoreductase n=1 Tax=Candidatus Solincola sediminis TaxID=1797199 RepID=A0A1F2WK73_9ACTN|nr:MAG: FAD-dependent oxidoreductase [Candidatus Solincola sediminis]OFW57260.1 MAG: FAD-dependent oxidoreductase [Candidatus Solincola sediminis]